MDEEVTSGNNKERKKAKVAWTYLSANDTIEHKKLKNFQRTFVFIKGKLAHKYGNLALLAFLGVKSVGRSKP